MRDDNYKIEQLYVIGVVAGRNIVYLMIATVMGIASIITFWGSSLVEQTLPPENRTEELCHAALFRFYSGNYDKSLKSLHLILENQRSIDLRIEKLYLFYQDGMETFELNEELNGNMLKSIDLTGIEDGFSSGTIKTDCPEVSADFSYSQVS